MVLGNDSGPSPRGTQWHAAAPRIRINKRYTVCDLCDAALGGQLALREEVDHSCVAQFRPNSCIMIGCKQMVNGATHSTPLKLHKSQSLRLGARPAAGVHRRHAVGVCAAFTLVSPDGSKKTYDKVQQRGCLHAADLASGRAAGIRCNVP